MTTFLKLFATNKLRMKTEVLSIVEEVNTTRELNLAKF